MVWCDNGKLVLGFLMNLDFDDDDIDRWGVVLGFVFMWFCFCVLVVGWVIVGWVWVVGYIGFSGDVIILWDLGVYW